MTAGSRRAVGRLKAIPAAVRRGGQRSENETAPNSAPFFLIAPCHEQLFDFLNFENFSNIKFFTPQSWIQQSATASLSASGHYGRRPPRVCRLLSGRSSRP